VAAKCSILILFLKTVVIKGSCLKPLKFSLHKDLIFCFLNMGDPDVLAANDIGEFFVQKIERIHAEFDSSVLGTRCPDLIPLTS
jgi:hypothetical protein